MNIQITGKNLNIGQSLREYAQGQLDGMVNKYVGRSYPGHIRIEKIRNSFATKCTVDLWSGLTLNSHAESADPFASVDLALEKLEKRLRRHKRRLHDHHRLNGHSKWPESSATDYVIDGHREDESATSDEPADKLVVAESQTIIRQLPVSEAVMDLDLANRPFLLFRNASHGRINIVYRREDGHIGWIDPDEQ